MKFPHAQIMIFAKAPIPGEVKTRLIPSLGKQGAATLYEQLARQTVATAVNTELCPVRLWCYPLMQHRFFETCRSDFGVMLRLQRGHDLGERMSNAFKTTLESATSAVIIGTDCPALTEQDLHDALTALEEGYDAVLGPAEDGGYVLLGLRHAEPSLFENIAWGRTDVLDNTRARMRLLGWRWHELAPRWDVDRSEDVGRLLKSGLLKDNSFLIHHGNGTL